MTQAMTIAMPARNAVPLTSARRTTRPTGGYMTADTDLSEPLSLAEEQAYHLVRCAVALDRARAGAGIRSAAMTEALNANLELWVALAATMRRDDCPLSGDTRRNLIALSDFVAANTFRPEALDERKLDSMINVNLQISEGLLEGVRRRAQVQDL